MCRSATSSELGCAGLVAALAWCTITLPPLPAVAQRLAPVAVAWSPLVPGARAAPPLTSLRSEPPAESSSPWWAPLASAVAPGTGQLALGQRRGVPYLAVEAFLLAEYAQAVRDGSQRRREYKDLARRVARAFLSQEGPDGDFQYYERMMSKVESGVFDMFPGGEIEPELDTSTFNGKQWHLARATFWENPDAPPARDSEAYQQALDFYLVRAVRPEYRWSWRNAQLEWDLFGRTIERSNDAFRRSAGYLGAVIANHALSAVDAFVTLRIRRGMGARTDGYGLEASIPWAPFGRPAQRH